MKDVLKVAVPSRVADILAKMGGVLEKVGAFDLAYEDKKGLKPSRWHTRRADGMVFGWVEASASVSFSVKNPSGKGVARMTVTMEPEGYGVWMVRADTDGRSVWSMMADTSSVPGRNILVDGVGGPAMAEEVPWLVEDSWKDEENWRL